MIDCSQFQSFGQVYSAQGIGEALTCLFQKAPIDPAGRATDSPLPEQRDGRSRERSPPSRRVDHAFHEDPLRELHIEGRRKRLVHHAVRRMTRRTHFELNAETRHAWQLGVSTLVGEGRRLDRRGRIERSDGHLRALHRVASIVHHVHLRVGPRGRQHEVELLGRALGERHLDAQRDVVRTIR